MTNQTIAIETKGLTCRFGTFTAVDHLDLQVVQGTIYGFIGSNGSGKSTTIRMLCGLLKPSEGQALVLGYDAVAETEAIRQHLGYMSQKFSLYLDLTAGENLNFYGGLYGLGGVERQERVRAILERMNLMDKQHVLAGSLSGGQKQRLALGCAVLHHPEVLILDEPTSAVDPTSRRLFWNLLADLVKNEGTTILVTTHFMDEAEHCDGIGFLKDGRLIANGSPQHLKGKLPARLYRLPYDNLSEARRALAAAAVPVLDVYATGRRIQMLVRPDTVLPEHMHAAVAELTMEDVFIYYDKHQEVAEHDIHTAQSSAR
jgi:ABC-2 type transport system ATP-binding protein